MSSDEQNEISKIALEMVLGYGAKKPVSIPDSEWLTIQPIILEQALISFENFRYPILKPARPIRNDTSLPLETTEDTFAISDNPNLRLTFSQIFYCLGIEIIHEKRRMTVHLLNRSLPAQQATLLDDIESLSNQIHLYWHQASAETPQIKFISPLISSGLVDYQIKAIESIKLKFPHSPISYLEANTDII